MLTGGLGQAARVVRPERKLDSSPFTAGALYGRGPGRGRAGDRAGGEALPRPAINPRREADLEAQGRSSLMGNVDSVLATRVRGGVSVCARDDDEGAVAARRAGCGRAGSARGAGDASRPAEHAGGSGAALGLTALSECGCTWLGALGFQVGVADGVSGARTRWDLRDTSVRRGWRNPGISGRSARSLVATGEGAGNGESRLPANRSDAAVRECRNARDGGSTAGSFRNGALLPGEKGRRWRRGPAHRVRISNPFALGLRGDGFRSANRVVGLAGADNPDDRMGKGKPAGRRISWGTRRNMCAGCRGRRGRVSVAERAEWGIRHGRGRDAVLVGRRACRGRRTVKIAEPLGRQGDRAGGFVFAERLRAA